MKQQKRLKNPMDNVSDNEPDDITPFLEHPTNSQQPQASTNTDGSTAAFINDKLVTPIPTPKISTKFNIKGTLFHDAVAMQNRFKMYDSLIPNDITLLTACDYTPPLSPFTTEALEHIHDQKGLKFVRLGMGHYENACILDVMDFPADKDLTPTTWCLAYNTFLNWMSKRAQGRVLEGWTAHHDAMVNDLEFQAHFQAYVSFDKDVCSCFFTNGPFIIDPTDFHWSNALVNKKIANSTKVITASSIIQDTSSHKDHSFHYFPYDNSMWSFHSSAKTQFTPLCLRCGCRDGHRAPCCEATTPSRNKHRWVSTYKNGNLVCISNNKSICTCFNIGTCSSSNSSQNSHGLHICSLCNDAHHAAIGCTRN